MAVFTIIVNESVSVGDSLGTQTATPVVVNHTILEQTRRVNYVDGSIDEFVIENLITNKGQLPYAEVFVMQVVTRTDPKDDRFLRVASLGDLTTLPRGRNAGLLSTTAESFQFIDSTATIKYDALDTAVAGQTAIRDRVNILVKDWIQYQEEFAAYPTAAAYNLPIADSDQTTQAITDYTAAKQDRVNKEELLSQSEVVLETAKANKTLYADLTTNLKTFASQAVERSQEMSFAKSALTNLLAASNAYYGASTCAGAGDRATFNSAVATATTANAQSAIDEIDHSSYAISLQTYAATIESTKLVWDAEVLTATTNYNSALQAYNDALAAENAALNYVLTLCPDFDPETVIVCPTV
jgi:hypothetical protein